MSTPALTDCDDVQLFSYRIAGSEPVSHFVTGNDNNGVAFGRGSNAFVAINIGDSAWVTTVQTGMAAGSYCDIINSAKRLPILTPPYSSDTKLLRDADFAKEEAHMCFGVVNVNVEGVAQLNVPAKGAVAFHFGWVFGQASSASNTSLFF
jgi:hypothetical protein